MLLKFIVAAEVTRL